MNWLESDLAAHRKTINCSAFLSQSIKSRIVLKRPTVNRSKVLAKHYIMIRDVVSSIERGSKDSQILHNAMRFEKQARLRNSQWSKTPSLSF
jgi:hypothetical protein